MTDEQKQTLQCIIAGVWMNGRFYDVNAPINMAVIDFAMEEIEKLLAPNPQE